MSALLHIGEADHKLLNADAEIIAVVMGAANASIANARRELAEARAALGAVRLALRSRALAEALEYHHEMMVRLREAARLQRVPVGCGLYKQLYKQADQHAARARALRVLIGAGTFLPRI